MAKYLIPDFCEMENPKIEEVKSVFSIGSEFVKVTATIVNDKYRFEPVYLGQMPNTESWGDEELQSFALNALEKFKV